MKSIVKWLEGEGLNYSYFDFKDYNYQGVMVDTEYEGPYPSKETMQTIRKIEKKVDRSRNYLCETRGFYSGVLITKKNGG